MSVLQAEPVTGKSGAETRNEHACFSKHDCRPFRWVTDRRYSFHLNDQLMSFQRDISLGKSHQAGLEQVS